MTETPQQERKTTVQQLDAAISRNAGKPLIPWDEAKADLGLYAASVQSSTELTPPPSPVRKRGDPK